ncbi:10260_t:CDS:2, partial [Rhizophagus irregularis]
MSNYPGQNIIIEYLKERGSKSTYCGFLNFNSDFITASISPTDTCDNLDTVWFYHFLREAKSLFNQKTYIVIKNKTSDIKSSEISQPDRIIKEHKKENLAPAVTSHLNKTLNKTSDIKLSEISQPDSNETKKYVEQKGKLKRVRDDSNTDTESLSN